jgi:NAD(P)-dependent dehydrogenase (short-subunit alcohol dehydrogenase family)
VKTVLVTGANRGLGLEFVRQYAGEGWQVLAASRRGGPELESLAAEHPGRVRCFSLDVTDHAAVDRLAVELAGEAIDVLINNAGYLGRIPFDGGGVRHQAFGNLDYQDWELTLRINVLAPMRMAEAFVEHVARSGERKMVAITSMLGSMGLNTTGGLYAYRSSKAALNAVLKSLSIDLARRGVMAVALHPGWVRTAMGGSRAEIDATESVQGMRTVIAGLTPDQVGRVYAWDGSVLPY